MLFAAGGEARGGEVFLLEEGSLSFSLKRSLFCGENSRLWLFYERTRLLFSVWREAVCPSPRGEVAVNDSLINCVVPSEESIQDIVKSVEDLFSKGPYGVK